MSRPSSSLPPPRHRGALAAVTAAVLLAHAGLLGGPWWHAGWALAPGDATPPPPGRPALQVRRLPAPPPAPAPAAPAPPVPLEPEAGPSPAAPPAPPAEAAPAAAPPAEPAPPAPPEPAPEGPPQTGADPGSQAGVADTPGQAADDSAHALQPLMPLPALRLRYQAERGPWRGQAQLDWEPLDGIQYRLDWRLALDGRDEQAWLSQGLLGPSGLAPTRMVERRRDRDVAAVNFQREKGLVSFSGPTITLPLPPGAQDRASWLLQLPLMAQAAAGHWTAGSTLSFPLFTVRGEPLEWRFELLGPETLSVPASERPLAAWHLRREPIRPYDQRVDIWLARDHGLIPLQLRLTPVPGSETLSLTLRDGLPPAQPAPGLGP